MMTVAFIVFNLCVISITAMLLNSSYSKLVCIILSISYNLSYVHIAMDFMKSKPLLTLLPCLGTIAKAFCAINATDVWVEVNMQS